MAESVPSFALTMTSKRLSPLASAAISKFGAVMKRRAPVTGSTVKRAASAPPTML